MLPSTPEASLAIYLSLEVTQENRIAENDFGLQKFQF